MSVIIDTIPIVVFLFVGALATLAGLGEMVMFVDPYRRRASGTTAVSFMGGLVLFMVGIGSLVITAISAFGWGKL